MVQFLSLRAVVRDIEMKPKFGRFFRVAAAAGGMALAVWALKSAGAPLSLLILGAATTYPVMLLTLRALDPQEFVGLLRR